MILIFFINLYKKKPLISFLLQATGAQVLPPCQKDRRPEGSEEEEDGRSCREGVHTKREGLQEVPQEVLQREDGRDSGRGQGREKSKQYLYFIYSEHTISNQPLDRVYSLTV